MFLPSTLDPKADIQQYNNNVHLPADLDSSAKRKDIVKVFYAFMKEVGGVSNHNLVRNLNAYMPTGGAINPKFKYSWIDNLYVEAQQKFELGYKFFRFQN